MDEDQFKRLEALLLLNSFYSLKQLNPTIAENEIWERAAKNLDILLEFLKNNSIYKAGISSDLCNNITKIR